jgi:N-acetylmuramoyl-L-alanine amidase
MRKDAGSKNAGRAVAGPAAAAALLAAFALLLCSPALAQQRTIVIDPGHGALDVGAKGKFGAVEKDVDLAISLKLKALIESNMAYRVVLTRTKDIDVSLDNRAAIANENGAAVFISVHANGSFRKKARGSETFFLSLNATDEESRKLAYEENTAAGVDKRIVEDDKDLVKMILWDMAQSAYVKQSSRLAELVQRELNALLGTENRGIKQANFAVLRGVACPAILVEAAFISNPEEEQLLVDDGFQSRVAEAVYRGLAAYLKLLRQD